MSAARLCHGRGSLDMNVDMDARIVAAFSLGYQRGLEHARRGGPLGTAVIPPEDDDCADMTRAVQSLTQQSSS
jgi:hypothetical protein